MLSDVRAILPINGENSISNVSTGSALMPLFPDESQDLY